MSQTPTINQAKTSQTSDSILFVVVAASKVDKIMFVTEILNGKLKSSIYAGKQRLAVMTFDGDGGGDGGNGDERGKNGGDGRRGDDKKEENGRREYDRSTNSKHTQTLFHDNKWHQISLTFRFIYIY